MKTIMRLAGLLSVGALLLTGCGSDSDTNEVAKSTYSLNVGIAMNEQDPMYEGALKFKEAVEDRTNGDVEVNLFSSSQLGSTPDLLEQAQMGANVATLTDAGSLGDMVRQISILMAPYIVDNYEQGQKLVASDLFSGWQNELNSHGIKVLSFNWYQGARQLATTTPVLVPDDLNGLAIRTNGTVIVNKAIQMMGGNPTGLAWAEAYPGLQQGVIDGVEAHYSAIQGARLPEVISSIAKTNHFQLLTALTVSDQWFNNLPEEFQKILIDESFNAGEYASDLNIERALEYEENMMKSGVDINDVDISLFKKKTDHFYDEFEGFRDLREQVNQVLNNSTM